MSNVLAGWYPSPEDPTQVRYWDGLQWTQHSAPAVATQPTSTSEPAPVPGYAAPPAPTASAFAPPAPAPVAATPTDSKKKWLIGGAIAAGVIVVGSVGAAIGAGGSRDEPAPQASAPAVVAEPTPEPTPEAVEETVAPAPAAPAVEVVDAVGFRAQGGSHLDDMQKDLDDIVTTVEEDGFWRLLSNNGELAFNQAQLESLDVPANVAEAWPAALATQQVTLDTLSAAIETQDGPSILAAVDVVRAQVEASRGVVNSAQ